MRPSATTQPPGPGRLLRCAAFACAATALAACDSGPSAEEHFQRGVAFEAEGDLPAAVIEFKNVLVQDGDHGDARLHLAQIYLQLGDGAAAQKEFERAASLEIDAAEAERGLLDALALQGRHEDVLQRLVDAALEGSAVIPASETAVYRGFAHAGLEELDAARRDFETALERDPGSSEARRGLAAVAYWAGDLDEALRQLDLGLDAEPDSANVLVAKGDLELRRGDAGAAEQAYRQAIASEDTMVLARIGLARVLLAQGKVDEAVAEMEGARAVLWTPSIPLDYLEAVAAAERDDLALAREKLQGLLRTVPNHPEALYLMARLHYRAQEYEQAVELSRQLVNEVPGFVDGSRLLAYAYLGLNQPQEAVRTLEALTREVEVDGRVYALLADAYMRAGRRADAVGMLETATRLEPEFPLIRARLAGAYLAAGAPGETIALVKSSRDAGTPVEQGDYFLIEGHLQRGEYEQVLELAQSLREAEPDSPVPDIYAGQAYEGLEEIRSAREAYEAALAIDPEFAPARVRLANLDLRADKLEEARAHLEAVMASDSADVRSLRTAAHTLARMQVRDGSIEGARGWLRALLDRSPHDELALTSLAELAADGGQMEEAIALLEEAREHNQNSTAPLLMLASYRLRLGQTSEALAAARQANRIAPDDPQTLTVLGQTQVRAGLAADAGRTFQRLVEIQPESAQAWFLLGSAAQTTGDRDGARAAYTTALAREPGHVPATSELARMEIRAGRYDEARTHARSLQETLSRSPLGYTLEGDALRAAGEPSEAIASYRAALERGGDGAVATSLYAMMRQTGDAAAAAAFIQEWSAKHPTDVLALETAAIVAFEQGAREDVVRLYEQIVELRPDHATALNNLAWLYHEDGDARAMELARRAYEASPVDPDVLDTYGWLLVENGQTEQGVAQLRRAIALAPGAPTTRYHLGAALAKAGDTAAAIDVLSELLDSDVRFDEEADARLLYDQLRSQ